MAYSNRKQELPKVKKIIMNKTKKYITAFCLIASATVNTAYGQITYVEENEKNVVAKNENGNDEQIDMPEAMLQNIDSLLNQYHAKMYLQPDADCNMQDINPYFEPEVYKQRLSRLPTIIEMPYNDIVQKFIDKYTTQLRRSVSMMLGASNFYMPVFEQALEMYNVPLELKYLPVIESALNPTAVSRVGATGIWQFMINTGKQYGLNVNTLVDERRDPFKASYAAAHYLRDLYNIFGDWTLAIAAYNAGPENINKAIKRAGGIKDYWAIYPYLPRETRGYVPGFIAANYIMNYYCEHNICPMVTTLPTKTDTIMVNRDVHLQQVAAVLNLDIEQIKAINPQYRHNIVNGSTEPSPIRLPQTHISMFLENEDSIYAYQTEQLLTKRTEVVINDNDLNAGNGKKSRYSKRNKRSRSKSVTIRKGDTLSEIAKRNGTTVAKLKRLNKISGSNIRAGKKIRVR